MFRYVKQSRPVVLLKYQPRFMFVDRFTEKRCSVCFEKLGPTSGFPCPECNVKIHGGCRTAYRNLRTRRVRMLCRMCGETD